MATVAAFPGIFFLELSVHPCRLGAVNRSEHYRSTIITPLDDAMLAKTNTWSPLLIVMLVIGGSQPVSASLFDTEFENADWHHQVRAQGNRLSIVALQQGSGGNPDAYRQTSQQASLHPSIKTIRVSHFYDGMVYDPGVDGPLASVDIHFDAKVEALEVNGSTTDVLFGAAIKQGNNVFHLTPSKSTNLVGVGDWDRLSFVDLFPDDFDDTFGLGNTLDFSATGDDIRFGYSAYIQSIHRQFGSTMALTGVDNWWASPQTGVPEASSLMVFLTLFGFAFGGGYLRKSAPRAPLTDHSKSL